MHYPLKISSRNFDYPLKIFTFVTFPIFMHIRGKTIKISARNFDIGEYNLSKVKMKDYDGQKARDLKASATRKDVPAPGPNKMRAKVNKGNVKVAVTGQGTNKVKANVSGSKIVKSEPKKYGEGNNMTIRDGKANVSAAQLKKTGLSLRQYMNQWKKTGKRPS